MFDSAQLAWIVGVQGILQSIAMTVLWVVAFQKLRFGAAGVVMALMPVIGIFAVTFVTVIFGLLQITSISPFIAFSVLPSFIGFLFAAAPLMFLVVRLKSMRLDDVFD